MLILPQKEKYLRLRRRPRVEVDEVSSAFSVRIQNDTWRLPPPYQSMKTRLGAEWPEHQLHGGLGLQGDPVQPSRDASTSLPRSFRCPLRVKPGRWRPEIGFRGSEFGRRRNLRTNSCAEHGGIHF